LFNKQWWRLDSEPCHFSFKDVPGNMSAFKCLFPFVYLVSRNWMPSWVMMWLKYTSKPLAYRFYGIFVCWETCFICFLYINLERQKHIWDVADANSIAICIVQCMILFFLFKVSVGKFQTYKQDNSVMNLYISITHLQLFSIFCQNYFMCSCYTIVTSKKNENKSCFYWQGYVWHVFHWQSWNKLGSCGS
jgi:hypothetical protein